MKRIVILGGGFGGLEAARTARKNFSGEIVLINDTDYMVFHGNLHEIISERIKPDSLKIDLNDVLSKYHVEFKKRIVKGIKNNEVITNKEKIKFDALILALGSKTCYYECEGIKNKCDLLKNTDHAVELLNHLKKIKKGKIAIAGAGLTGVELAFEVMIHAKKYNKNFELHLIEGNDMVLPGFPMGARQHALKELLKIGVKVDTNCRIEKGRKQTLCFSNKKKLKYDLLIWAAGIKPSVNPKKLGLKTERGFIQVNKKLQAKNNIFAIGDIAYVKTKKGHDPWTATSALYQGRIAGFNAAQLLHKKKLFDYKPGKKHLFLVSLGKQTGIMSYGNFALYGKTVLLFKKLFRYWYMQLHT